MRYVFIVEASRGIRMAAARTGAERYIEQQKRDPEFQAAHADAARRIRQVDALVRALDDARERQGMTKAELARRAGMPPEAVRRLFTADSANPTAATLIALADALDVEVIARPARKSAAQRSTVRRATNSSRKAAARR
jgi:DNA-binding phage protein